MLHSSLFFTFYPAPHVLLPALFWEPLCTHNFSIMRRQPRLLLHSTLACGWKVTKCSLPALATAGDVSASPGTNTMQWNSQSKRMLGHHLTARSHLQEEVFLDVISGSFLLCRNDVPLHYNSSGSLPGDRGGNTCLEVCFTHLLIENIFLTLCML